VLLVLVAGVVGGPVAGLLKSDGDFDPPVAAPIASRAWTDSAPGGSKSPSDFNRPATGPPTTPATSTRSTAPARTARRRRWRKRARRSSMGNAPWYWL